MARRRAAAVAAGTLGLLLTACGVTGHAGGGASAPGTVNASGCGEAGLAAAGQAAAAMPVPDRLPAPESFPQASITLLPPGPEDAPLLPPERAWQAALTAKRAGVRYELVLARMSADFPAAMGAGVSSTPLYQGVLVWVVVTHAVPMVAAGGSSGAASCFLADQLDVTDATTGRFLLSSSFGTRG